MLRRRFFGGLAALAGSVEAKPAPEILTTGIVDARKGDRGILRDAMGRECPTWSVSANLDTGWVLLCCKNSKGKKYLIPGTRRVAQYVEYYPAPMTYERFPAGHPLYGPPKTVDDV